MRAGTQLNILLLTALNSAGLGTAWAEQTPDTQVTQPALSSQQSADKDVPHVLQPIVPAFLQIDASGSAAEDPPEQTPSKNRELPSEGAQSGAVTDNSTLEPVSAVHDEPVDKGEQTARESRVEQPMPESPAEVSNKTATGVSRQADAADESEPVRRPLSHTQAFREHPSYAASLKAIREGKSASVLSELGALEADFAGDVEFDYVLGVVLLDTGDAPQALYALQRAAQQKPHDLGIQLDLGRAYFETGENESARNIFKRLQALQPPEKAARVIDSYLQAGDRIAARYERRLNASLEFDAGLDSNANSASELREFIGFELDENARSSESSYTGLRGQIEYSRPITARWRWFADGMGVSKFFTDVSEVNSLSLGLGAGVRYRQGDWNLGSRLSASQTAVDGSHNNLYLALTQTWNYRLSQFWRSSASLKYGLLRFADELSARDVNQLLGSVSLARSMRWGRGGEFVTSLLAGHDASEEASSPYGRNLFGVQAQAFHQLSINWLMLLHLQILNSDYAGEFFNIARKDQQTAAGLNFRYVNPKWQRWQLMTKLNYTKNDSDVAVYSFDRTAFGLSLRRSFD